MVWCIFFGSRLQLLYTFWLQPTRGCSDLKPFNNRFTSWCFQKCPIYQLERAWKYIATPCKYPPTAAEISKNQWLRAWTPVTFKDPASRTYHRYHPVLLETGTKLYYVVCFDQSTPQDKSLGINNFIALPPLNFLPPGCDKVIAGSAGANSCFPLGPFTRFCSLYYILNPMWQNSNNLPKVPSVHSDLVSVFANVCHFTTWGTCWIPCGNSPKFLRSTLPLDSVLA